MSHQQFARRSLKLRFFCHFIFLPFLWLRLNAALVNHEPV